MTSQTHAQSALVTGASGGVGKLVAQLLARRGFRVFGASRSQRPDEAGVEMIQLDVRSASSVQQCVAEAVARAGSLDVLINNAGVEHIGVAEETTEADARAVFETNFFGAVRMVNAVLPEMRRRRSGRIINVGSIAAWLGEPGEAFYAASKGALARYSEALRYELQPLGVGVSLVELGAFRTDILASATFSERRTADYDAVRDAARRTLERGLRNGADPARAAACIVRAARARRPRARYVAGVDAFLLPFAKLALPCQLLDALLLAGFGIHTSVTEPGSSRQRASD